MRRRRGLCPIWVKILWLVCLCLTAPAAEEWGNSRPRVDRFSEWAFNQRYFESAEFSQRKVVLRGEAKDSAGKPVAGLVLITGAQEGATFRFSPTARFPHLPCLTKTDADGKFSFESIDPDWDYYLIALAPGFEQVAIQRVAPREIAKVELKPRKLVEDANSSPRLVSSSVKKFDNQMLRGRVLDNDGNPMALALIRILGTTRNNMMSWPASDIDAYGISDAQGQFTIHAAKAFEAAEGAVEVPGYLTAVFENWKSGNEEHQITLRRGASVRGRIVRDGGPVPNAELRLSNFGRDSSVWSFSALTDAEGRFEFKNVPPNRFGWLRSTMESLAGRGALPNRWVQTRGETVETDLGDLSLQPSFDLRGRIRLSDKKPIPANAQVVLMGVDRVPVSVEGDGSFEFRGVPPETVQLIFRVPGYQFTPQDSRMIAGSSTNIAVGPGMWRMEFEMFPRK